MDNRSRGQGWESIQRVLENLYSGREPQHFGTIQRYAEGGKDPLDGISAYVVDNPRHWHLISFGLSELYGKEFSNLRVSGWGFELTFRLVRKEGEITCPSWALQFLQTLARYVFNTSEIFDQGHYISMGGRITQNGSAEMTGLVFWADPQLPEIQTENGPVKFIQAICITEKELSWIEEWSAEEFIALYAQVSPLLVSDLNRQSLVE